MSDKPDGDPPERRAGELLRSGASAAIDPALAERLKAFFTEPVPAKQKEWVAPPGWSVPEETPEQKLRKAEALAAVDLRWVGRMERRGEARGALVEPPVPPEPTIDESLIRFRVEAWRLGFAGEPREIERPEDLRDALADAAPQAILRDLHRPVFRFDMMLERKQLAELGSPGDEARTAMRQSYRVPVTERESPSVTLVAVRDGRRYWLRELSWADARPETPSPRPSAFPDANDFKWFGSVGYDPDL